LSAAPLSDERWELAKLPSRLGGMALRTGKGTASAVYTTSVLKTRHAVQKLLGESNQYPVVEVLDSTVVASLNEEQNAGVAECPIPNWSGMSLVAMEEEGAERQGQEEKRCDQAAANAGRPTEVPGVSHKTNPGASLSLKQLSATARWLRLRQRLTDDERVFVEASSGGDHRWVNARPNVRKREQYLDPVQFFFTVRRRLRLPVLPYAARCPNCNKTVADVYGDHLLACTHDPNLTVRHDCIAGVIAEDLKQTGRRVLREQKAGANGKKRPADVWAGNWLYGKALVLDTKITGADSDRAMSAIAEGGAGAWATKSEQGKVNKYKELKTDEVVFVPFLIETTGGLGRAAKSFCKEANTRAEERRAPGDTSRQKTTWAGKMLTKLSFVLQQQQANILRRWNPQDEGSVQRMTAVSLRAASLSTTRRCERSRQQATDSKELLERNKTEVFAKRGSLGSVKDKEEQKMEVEEEARSTPQDLSQDGKLNAFRAVTDSVGNESGGGGGGGGTHNADTREWKRKKKKKPVGPLYMDWDGQNPKETGGRRWDDGTRSYELEDLGPQGKGGGKGGGKEAHNYAKDDLCLLTHVAARATIPSFGCTPHGKEIQSVLVVGKTGRGLAGGGGQMDGRGGGGPEPS